MSGAKTGSSLINQTELWHEMKRKLLKILLWGSLSHEPILQSAGLFFDFQAHLTYKLKGCDFFFHFSQKRLDQRKGGEATGEESTLPAGETDMSGNQLPLIT